MVVVNEWKNEAQLTLSQSPSLTLPWWDMVLSILSTLHCPNREYTKQFGLKCVKLNWAECDKPSLMHPDSYLSFISIY